jgi:Holliday junction resolvasome RuvABC ATP-dependent DNA helicase subunit
LRLELDPYSDEEMAQIVQGMAFDLEAEISPEEAKALGMAAGGIPRSARDLVRAWRALSFQGTPTVEGALLLTGREFDGLTEGHLAYLKALDKLEGHGGERVLCSLLRVHPQHLNSLERLLVTRGLISLTPTGRVLTGAGDARMRGAKEERSFRRVVAS